MPSVDLSISMMLKKIFPAPLISNITQFKNLNAIPR